MILIINLKPYYGIKLMTIVKEYLELTEKYKKEYGEKTLLLMQVGSFFEVYGLLDKNDNIYGSNITEFSEINDMTISRKNLCVGKSKVVMAGFGLPQLEKYLKKLQDNGYTIIVYVQDSPSKNTTRSLHSICSPGTYFSNDTKELTNNILCIWINKHNNIITKREEITIGLSNLDIYTGKTSIFEFSNIFSHNPATYDELERYISIYHPNECIIISNLSESQVNDIINFTNINSNKIHIIYNNDSENPELLKLIKNSEKQTYQQEIINKFYSINDIDIFFQGLLEYCIAIQAFVYLLDFTYKHNPYLVNKINKPIFENYTNRLLLANHSLKQLNIITDYRYTGKFSCVNNLLNNSITPMGKREFSYNLLNPITDINLLNISYNITDHLLNQTYETTQTWKHYRLKLNNIKDIEKLKRKLIMKKISPKDFYILHDNLKIILDIYNTINKDKTLVNYFKDNNIVNNFKNLKVVIYDQIDFIVKNINLDKAKFLDDISNERLGNMDIDKIVYINSNLDSNIDKYYRASLESKQQIECIRKYLSDLLGKYEKSAKTTDFIKIHETAKNDCTLQGTKRRVTFLKKSIEEEIKNNNLKVNIEYKSDYLNDNVIYEFDLTQLEFINNGSNQTTMIITSPQIRKIAHLINSSKNDLISSEEIFYLKFINNFKTIDLDDIIKLVIEIDILQSKCYIATEYNYCKPVIEENKNSFIEFTGIRHCLIEHLNTKELYVTNDFKIGENFNLLGILLYGTNAVGKTSFIKAIGISIIMAQAGLYVPATTFRFNPYKTIFTRILGNDNIFKGLSTFAVEMIELRTILQMADSNSLILGDELCSGTESDSALSIFMTGLEKLYSKKSTFLFATHFHEIINYEELKNLELIKLYHMSVIYDNTSGKLVYDRKIKEGPGDSMYGLEVCKSLELPDDFLERAHNLRIKYNNTYNNVLNMDVSKYNSKKIKGICEFCKKEMGSEIHHLEYQKDAINNYIINSDYNFNKNHPANLANICEKCHNKIHKKNERYARKKINKNHELVYLGE